MEDVKTFNSEVHEYEYYPYESYGKQVSDTCKLRVIVRMFKTRGGRGSKGNVGACYVQIILKVLMYVVPVCVTTTVVSPLLKDVLFLFLNLLAQ